MGRLAKWVCSGLLPFVLGASGCAVGVPAETPSPPHGSTPASSKPPASLSPEDPSSQGDPRSEAAAFIDEREEALGPAFVHSADAGGIQLVFAPAQTEARIVVLSTCFVSRDESVEIVVKQAGYQLTSMTVPCTRDAYAGELAPTEYKPDGGDVTVLISDPEVTEVRVFGFAEKGGGTT